MEVLKKTNSLLVATKETGIYGKQKSNVNNNYCMSFCDECDGEKTKIFSREKFLELLKLLL
ncbi:hypothetical protein [Chryseobacterium sp. SIMBA_029]|uniref:hypothetical protein n=1 Tax=Chryseobacterium sp. SIMBA_029 TaxID=3085772 RepID=UPI00397AB423